jgi:hypothetical protein
MLAPIDKLKSKVNDIIQIIVTTACTLQCSNCTQLLPFRKDARHMSVECFREAVRSLNDWPGVIGIFGGNPCNHPKFPELCKILQEEIPDQWHRGLWSNDLRQHGEIARETFYPHGRFNLNAHGVKDAAFKIKNYLPGKIIVESEMKQAEHSTILANYRDLDVPEEDWRERRERCDINQKWSGAIAEREGKPYAYFCEVAAALDGIRATNHGIPATPGWWKLSIAAFEAAGQVSKCCDAGCGVPLRMKGHKDNEEIYDITPSWKEAVEAGPQPSLIKIHDTIPARVAETTDYMGRR